MRLAFFASILCLSSCVPTPDSYPIPAQHQPVTDADIPKPMMQFGEFFQSNDPGAERYLVKDVKPLEGATWRWTFVEPEFRFTLKSTSNRTFHVQFGINDRTFRDTGPVSIVFSVNGHLLDRVRYTSVGDKTFEKKVPEEWLNPGGETRVTMKILNPWTASDPGVKLGVVLQAAGFLSR